MNKQEEIIKRLKELSKLIKKHNYNYHTLDNPKISDKEFDKLVKENDTLEKKYPKLILRNSPNNIYGSKIKENFQKDYDNNLPIEIEESRSNWENIYDNQGEKLVKIYYFKSYKHMLYFINANYYNCPTNYNLDSSIVRVNLNSFSFIFYFRNSSN